MWARTGCATEHERGALTGGRAWTGCPDRRQSVSAAHALTDWQGNTDTARCTALVQRVGAARALTTGRQYARARFPIDRRGVLLYPVSIGLKRVPHSNPTAKQFRKEVRRDERYNVLYVRTDQKNSFHRQSDRLYRTRGRSMSSERIKSWVTMQS